MPTGDDRIDVVRRLTGVKGTVRMHHEWVVRFEYGTAKPWVRRRRRDSDDPVITAVAGPDKLVLRGPRLPNPSDHRHVDDFDVHEGQVLTWSTTWLPSHLRTPGPHRALVDETIHESVQWVSELDLTDVPHADVVRRSLLTLHLMTHAETGGIVAAPTTSMPEDFGGERNWDYRYCWLRDAALTISALISAGRDRGGEVLARLAAPGRRRRPRRPADHVRRRRLAPPRRVDRRPAARLRRIAAGPDRQRRSGAAPDRRRRRGDARARGRPRLRTRPQTTTRGACSRCWSTISPRPGRTSDNGLWEIRGPLRDFTHSRVMVWAAFDRAVKAVERHGLPGDVDRWRAPREQVRDEVVTHGYDESRGTFTQHYATTEVDASLLMLPLVGFVDGNDPRMLGTIEAIEQDLMRDGLLLRYRTQTGVDGLSGDEHPFLACSFWLVSAYAGAGRLDDAHALFDRLVALRNDVGLLSEEYDAHQHRMVGNFPQAFSHLALVQAAFKLREAAAG